jgi:predicted Zn finger-like uncharacterized protein
MLIVCPDCSASYRLGPDALGSGRKVRCARCRTEWFADSAGGRRVEPAREADIQYPNEPPSSPDDPPAIEMQALSSDRIGPAPGPTAPRARFGWLRRAERRAREPRQRKVAAQPPRRPRFRWVAVFAAVGIGLVAGAMFERVAFVRVAPGLASLYAAVGLPVNVRGLEISDVASVEEIEEGVPILLVTGAVRNISDAPLDVPRLRLAVTSGGDRELYSWTTIASKSSLKEGERTRFRARLASPPAEGQTISVRFLARQDVGGHTR